MVIHQMQIAQHYSAQPDKTKGDLTAALFALYKRIFMRCWSASFKASF